MNQDHEFVRTEALLGQEAMEKLYHARVAVFGIGGVGSYAVEALARSGVGTLDIIDNDIICASNINRQIIANHKTLGQSKVNVMKERITEINPNAIVHAFSCFFDKTACDQFLFSEYDYIIDAIDTVTSKILLAEISKQYNVPLISSMGVGNKLYSERLKITDISKTSVCPLARVIRRELKLRSIHKLTVLYSDEPPLKPLQEPAKDAASLNNKRTTPGSIAFVPSVAGLMIAGHVIRYICGIE